jgi:hypothetical protein
MSTATVAKPKREKTSEEMVEGVVRQIAGLERRAAGEDPWMVADMLGLAEELKAAAVRVIAAYRYPDAAGAPAYRWADIAFSLGITPETAIKRYKKEVDKINFSRAAEDMDESMRDIASGELPDGGTVKCGNRLDLPRELRRHRYQELGPDARNCAAAGFCEGTVYACQVCGADKFTRKKAA